MGVLHGRKVFQFYATTTIQKFEQHQVTFKKIVVKLRRITLEKKRDI